MTGYRHLRTLALALTATVAAAAARAAGPGSTTWTVDDILLAGTASWWATFPDGALAAWVRSIAEGVEGNEKRGSDLWLTRLAVGTSFAMPRGQGNAVAPGCTGLRVVVGAEM